MHRDEESVLRECSVLLGRKGGLKAKSWAWVWYEENLAGIGPGRTGEALR